MYNKKELMYPDIVVFAGGAIGIPISICRNIRKVYEVNTYIICINSLPLQSIFNKSKYVTEVFAFDGIESSSGLLKEMETWYYQMNFQQKPVLISTTDISCIYVNDFRDRYEDLFLLTFPSSKIIDVYTSKGLAEIDASEHGLTVPKSRLVSNSVDRDFIEQEFNFPVIIKPVSTRSEDKLGFKTKICDQNDFRSYANSFIKNNHHFLCQEYISGSDNSVWFYLFVRSHSGNVLDVMGVKTLQSPPGNGIMAIGETQGNLELMRICRDFLSEIDYEGIGGLEFKYFNGKYYFIEMNIRTEAIVTVSDVTLPLSLIVYEDSIGILDAAKYNIAVENTKYIDFRPLLLARLSDKCYGFLLKDICRIFLDKHVRLNIFYKDDWKPFAYTFVLSIIHLFGNIFNKLNMSRK